MSSEFSPNSEPSCVGLTSVHNLTNISVEQSISKQVVHQTKHLHNHSPQLKTDNLRVRLNILELMDTIFVDALHEVEQKNQDLH